MKKNKKIKIKLKKNIYKKYSFYEIIKIIFGNLIKFIHYCLIRIFVIYILLFSKNFILNITAFAFVLFTLCFWYIFNCCIVTLLEQYILNEEKNDMNKILLTNYSKINILDTEVIVFNKVIYCRYVYSTIIIIILFLLKLIYLYNNK
jgi:hypothetical protein